MNFYGSKHIHAANTRKHVKNTALKGKFRLFFCSPTACSPNHAGPIRPRLAGRDANDIKQNFKHFQPCDGRPLPNSTHSLSGNSVELRCLTGKRCVFRVAWTSSSSACQSQKRETLGNSNHPGTRDSAGRVCVYIISDSIKAVSGGGANLASVGRKVKILLI